MSFQLAHPDGVAVPRTVTRALAAGAAFTMGAICLIDANGAIAECGADPASIAGVAAAACGTDSSGFNRLGKKEFPPGYMQLIVAKGQFFSAKYVGSLPAADGGSYGIVKDVDGDWKVDFSDTTATRVKLVDRRTASPENIARVIVTFIDANLQAI